MSVLDMSSLGGGAPDFQAGWKGQNYNFEVKRSDKAKLTPHEERFHERWRGQVAIVSTLEECLDLMGIWKSGKDYKAGKGR